MDEHPLDWVVLAKQTEFASEIQTHMWHRQSLDWVVLAKQEGKQKKENYGHYRKQKQKKKNYIGKHKDADTTTS